MHDKIINDTSARLLSGYLTNTCCMHLVDVQKENKSRFKETHCNYYTIIAQIILIACYCMYISCMVIPCFDGLNGCLFTIQ